MHPVGFYTQAVNKAANRLGVCKSKYARRGAADHVVDRVIDEIARVPAQENAGLRFFERVEEAHRGGRRLDVEGFGRPLCGVGGHAVPQLRLELCRVQRDGIVAQEGLTNIYQRLRVEHTGGNVV